ncbi:hypothetical protein SRHO_G00205520 [Serrasalmus rhombeus]
MVLTRTAPSTGRIYSSSSACGWKHEISLKEVAAKARRERKKLKETGGAEGASQTKTRPCRVWWLVSVVLLLMWLCSWPRRRTSRKSSSGGSFCRGPGFTVVEMDRVTHRGHQNPTNSSFYDLQRSWLELLRKLSSLWMTRGHESGEVSKALLQTDRD